MTRDQANAISLLGSKALQLEYRAEATVTRASSMDNERLPPSQRLYLLKLLRADIPHMEELLAEIKAANTILGNVTENDFDV